MRPSVDLSIPRSPLQNNPPHATNAQDAAAATGSRLLELPHCLLRAVIAALSRRADRAALALACRALASAVDEAAEAICVDAALFAASVADCGCCCSDSDRRNNNCAASATAAAGPLHAQHCAARVLPRARRNARRCVVRARASQGCADADADAGDDGGSALAALFALLARSKPRLEDLTVQERLSSFPPAAAELAALAGARWRYGFALCAAAAAAASVEAAAAVTTPEALPFANLRRLEMPPGCCARVVNDGGNGAAPDGAVVVAPLSRLAGLREVVLLAPDLDCCGPGLAPAALRELCAISGLRSLCCDLDARDGVEAAGALEALPFSAAAASLTQLRLGAVAGGGGAANGGEGAMPVRARAAAMLLGALPRLRRLELGRGVWLDCGGLSESAIDQLAAARSSAAVVPTTPCGRFAGAAGAAGAAAALPPLELVSLGQPELEAAGWRLLARLPRLESLELWRCGAPPAGIVALCASAARAPRRPLPAAGHDAVAAAAPRPAVAADSSNGNGGGGCAAPFARLERLHLGAAADDAAAAMLPLAAALRGLRSRARRRTRRRRRRCRHNQRCGAARLWRRRRRAAGAADESHAPRPDARRGARRPPRALGGPRGARGARAGHR